MDKNRKPGQRNRRNTPSKTNLGAKNPGWTFFDYIESPQASFARLTAQLLEIAKNSDPKPEQV